MQNSQDSQRLHTQNTDRSSLPTGHWVTSETGPKRKTSTLQEAMAVPLGKTVCKTWWKQCVQQHCNGNYWKNSLQNMVKTMCATALQWELLETRQITFFELLVLWNVQERTGHRSLEALRVYERSSAEQHKAASTILSTKQTTFQQQMVQNNITASTKPNVTVYQHFLFTVYRTAPSTSTQSSTSQWAVIKNSTNAI